MAQFAYLPDTPDGKDIQAAAKGAKLVKSDRGTAKLDGKSCTFTPAEILVHSRKP